jgi:cell division protein FtsA
MAPDFIVSIDVGTTKVSVLVGEVGGGDEIRIIGAGSNPSEGMKRGMVVNIERAAACVQRAIAEAERMAGLEIQGVCAGISGPHVKSFNSRGVIAIPTNRREISMKDVERVTTAAGNITLPSEREILHAIPQDFVVDNESGIRDPVGMSAMRLEAEVHLITGQTMSIENFAKVLRKAELDLLDIFFEPIATAKAVLTEDEMESGCMLVDMGGGVTGYALYQGGCLRKSGGIALGGGNVTNDIAIGLRVPVSVAEQLKCEHGMAIGSMPGGDEIVTLPAAGSRSNREIRKQIIASIIEPRCEEIFTLIKKELSSENYYRMLGSGIVLTGGGAKLEGIDVVAEQVFDQTVRIGRPFGLDGLIEIASDESWSTAAGLLLYEKAALEGRTQRPGLGARFGWMFDRLRKIASLF